MKFLKLSTKPSQKSLKENMIPYEQCNKIPLDQQILQEAGKGNF
jgi:hypothetical protein